MTDANHYSSEVKQTHKNWLQYFAEHRVAANLIMLLVIALGMMALMRLHVQVVPKVEIREIDVKIDWPGANAEDIERLITTPLEKRILNLDSVDRLTSRIYPGHTSIDPEYFSGTDMAEAERVLRETVEDFELPKNAELRTIYRETFKEPVMDIIFWSDGSIDESRSLINQFKTDLLAQGIPEIHIQGFAEQNIEVRFRQQRLTEMNTTLAEMAQVIRAANQDHSTGTVGSDFSEKSVKSLNQLESPESLANLWIYPNGRSNPVRLGDAADIELVLKDGQQNIYYQGKEAILFRAFRSDQMDSLEASNIINAWLDETLPNLPQGLQGKIYWDLSDFVRANINMLLSNGLFGLMFVVLTLFVFLNGKVAFWTAVGIPVSLLGTLLFIFVYGGSINYFSLFAMLMALGIIVDDAIVVGEESLSQFQDGRSASEAATGGAIRMFGPVLASSLTTIAAFSPLLFLPGEMGQMLRPIPVVVICVILASLIECFLILPGHLNHGFAKLANKKPSKFRQWFDSRFFAFRDGPFKRFVTWCIRNRKISVSTAVGFFVVAVGLMASGKLPLEGDLYIDDDTIYAWAVFTAGTPEEEIRAYSSVMEAGLRQAAAQSGVDDIIVDLYNEFDKGRRYTYFEAQLTPRDERSISNEEFLELWDAQVARWPTIERIKIGSGENAQGTEKLEIFMAGDSAEKLKQAAMELKTELEKYGELKNVEDDMPFGSEQVEFHVNAAGRSLGLEASFISDQVRLVLDGLPIQTFIRHDAEVDLIVSMAKDEANRLDFLQTIPLRTPEGSVVPLGQVIDTQTSKTMNSIRHDNGEMGIVVSADFISESTNFKELAKTVREDVVPPILQRYGLTGEYRGSSKELEKTLQNLQLLAVLALLMMYLILTWIFSSYSWPLAVMTAIPLGLTGAIIGHVVLGVNLTMLSLFGFFGLAGIIVNDSIILIGRYRELRLGGMEIKPAIVEASCQRLRAVFLTSITTVMGLVPILMETSVQAQLVQSMAASLAFGIAYGTILVLVVIPSVLTIIESVNASIHNLKSWFRARSRSRQTA